jgi:hypothetical protein
MIILSAVRIERIKNGTFIKMEREDMEPSGKLEHPMR